jgi:isopenicillin-N epimerase
VDLLAPLVPLDAFALDPAFCHVNHGSFGACPRAVLAVQDELRARLEAATMTFMVCEWQDRLDAARARVAAFIAADPQDVVLIPNTTLGVSTVLASLAWRRGDRIVVTDHGYRACRNAAERLAETHGVEVITVHVPVPITDPMDVVSRVVAAADGGCRLVLIDHITSPTALVIDVAAICAALASRGIDVLVDGAHAPGQLALDVPAIGAAYYVANAHKWLCAPKGTALLWARRDVRDALRPLVTSHGETPGFGPANRFHARFDWTGTHDPTGYLSIPAAIDTVARLGGGWPAICDRNHALVLAGRDLIAERIGARPIAPDAMTATMASLPIVLPEGATALGLERELLAAGIEAPIAELEGVGPLVRISAHVYNALADYGRLADELVARGVHGRGRALR